MLFYRSFHSSILLPWSVVQYCSQKRLIHPSKELMCYTEGLCYGLLITLWLPIERINFKQQHICVDKNIAFLRCHFSTAQQTVTIYLPHASQVFTSVKRT